MRTLLPVAALIASGLSLAPSWAHLLELGPRLGWSRELWIETTVVGGLYAEFGRSGALVDVATVLLLFALVLRTPAGRNQKGAWVAFCCFALALAVWTIGVVPANSQLARWADDPARAMRDFMPVSRRWEFSHALVAIIKCIGFGALAGTAARGAWCARRQLT